MGHKSQWRPMTSGTWHWRRLWIECPAVRLKGRFNIAGFAGWLACTVPTLVDIRAGHLSGWPAVAWSAGFFTFGAAYARYLRSESSAGRTPAAVFLVGAQAAAGLTMVWTAVGMTKYLSGITLTIVAGELPYIFSSRIVWGLIAVQSAVLTAIFWIHFGWLAALSGGGAFAAIHVFAVGQTSLERSERAAREELTRVNAELRSTRELLAENSRVTERLRISRDLHDALGHHLTALSIQLEIASHRIEGPAADHVREAHAITRLLLSEVRNVVSQLRETSRFDLVEAIRRLAAEGDGPRVHLDMPETLYLDEAAQATAMLRCVQEILTNATRHARARHVWIRLARLAGGIDLHAHDDGAGTAVVTLGNGLKGMRERFEEHAGTVEFTTAPGRGFEVHAFMPRPESTP